MFNILEGTTGAPSGGGSGLIIMLVIMLGVFYFFMIRPENKRKKEAEQIRSSVKNGDKITTIGGIVGTVVDVKEDRFVIETSADQVRVELMKWSLSTNESATERAAAEAKKAKEEKAKKMAEKRAKKNKQ
jgi:preprotein translocase subunit YajC